MVGIFAPLGCVLLELFLEDLTIALLGFFRDAYESISETHWGGGNTAPGSYVGCSGRI